MSAADEDTLAWPGAPASSTDPVEDGTRIDQIALAEKSKAAPEAVQATEMIGFAKGQVAEQPKLDVDPRRAWVGQGIADQIALACKVSPSEGSRRLQVARDLVLTCRPC